MSQVASETVHHFCKPWKLLASVCLTRMNRVSRELPHVEKQYANVQIKMEFENSVYSDYEFTKKKLGIIDAEKNQVLKQEREEVVEASRKLAAIKDNEEEWTADLNNIVVAPRKTVCDDDRNGKLDSILHCVVEDKKLYSMKSNIYPYTQLEDGETLRTASERLLSQYDLNQNTLFFSNAPVGVLKLYYGENEERGKVFQGAKIFFMRAHLQKVIDTDIEHVNWVTLQELNQFTDKSYVRKISTFVS